jgi:hypothetical protein
MFAFVAYWFLWAKEKKEMPSAKHIVPITQELMDSLARVCGRHGFQKKMKTMRRTVISEVTTTEAEDTEGVDTRDDDRAHRVRRRDPSVVIQSRASSHGNNSDTSNTSNLRRMPTVGAGNRTLEVVITEKKAIRERIKNSMRDLPLFYSMEQKLEREIEQLQAKKVDQANDSAEE